MNKQMKKWLMNAASLVVVGMVIFVAVMSACDWDVTKLDTVEYETNTYEVREAFRDVSITTEIADITFVPSDDGTSKVVCYEVKDEKHTISVQDGILTIVGPNEKQWHEYIGTRIHTESPKITVYLPEREYASLTIKQDVGDVAIPRDFTFQDIDISSSTGDVTSFASALEQIKIQTSIGDIQLEQASANRLELTATTGHVTVIDSTITADVAITVSTGKVTMTNVQCENLTSNSSTGDLLLKNVIASAKLSIEGDMSDVRLDGCDAAELFIKLNMGDVTGSLLSEKIFITQTNMGKIDVPQTTSGGICDISIDMGDIRLTIQ